MTYLQRAKYDNNPQYDAVRLAMEAAGKEPLLTREQEFELGKQTQIYRDIEARGMKISEATAEKMGMNELEFKRKMHAAQRAKAQFIRSNLRWVISIAKKYHKRGLDLADLIQDGALGLNRAAEMFDPDKGYKFSTYSYYWIRQAVTRALYNDSRLIRLPIHINEKLARLKKITARFYVEHGRKPTDREVSELSGIPVANLRELQLQTMKVTTLDRKVGMGEDSMVMLIADPNSHTEEAEFSGAWFHSEEIIELIKSRLEPMQFRVIELRYGLGGDKPMSLDQVGAVIGRSREAVRQIQNRAMRRLRTNEMKHKLGRYI